MRAFKVLLSLSLICPIFSSTASAAESAVARGKYLAQLGGCNDCHTPGSLLGKRDESRTLGGSDVAWQLPMGIFVGPNLTPDKETGLGKWSSADIVKALKTGVTPEGRVLAPIMPWRDFASMTDTDAKAIAAYLKSLPAVKNKVPDPLGPKDKSTLPMMTLVMPQ